jgi:hypothetical protein
MNRAKNVKTGVVPTEVEESLRHCNCNLRTANSGAAKHPGKLAGKLL